VATAASRPNLSGELTIQTWRDLSADKNASQYQTYLLMKQWEKNHPNVKVTYQPMVGNVLDLFNYITTNMRAQTLQDVVMMFYPGAAQLDPDRLYDLTADLGKPNPYSTNPTWKADFPVDGIGLKDVTVGGKTLMAGETFTGDLGDGAILYNQDLLDKAGITALPKTWADFTAALGKLKAAGIQPIYNPTAGSEAYILNWEMGILGDQLLGDVIKACDGQAGEKADGAISQIEAAWCVKKGKWNVSAPGLKTLLETIKDFSQYWHEGYLAPPAPGDLFTQGKVAFRWIARVSLPVVASDPNVKFKWGSFYLPPLKGTAGTPEGIVHRYGFVGAGAAQQYLFIPKTTVDRGKLDLALDLLQYVTSPKSNEFWCANQPVPCFTPGTTIDKIFPGDQAKQDQYRGFMDPPGVNNRVSNLDVSNAFGQAAGTQEIQIIQDYLSGKTNIDQTLQNYQKMLDQVVTNLVRQHPEWNADKW
jgi:ABC-type glycerol-3-phosphate transport system substrate-binding protein